MKLNLESTKNKPAWQSIGVELPKFDIEAVIKKTTDNPTWVHFGAGNIFRGFVAHAQQKLLDQGIEETGIIAVDSFDFEVIERIYRPYDNLSLMVLMKANGDFDKKVIASITESIVANTSELKSMKRLIEVFENPSLQMVSFTITEKGYALKNPSGVLYPFVESDINKGPDGELTHTMSIVASLLHSRYKKGEYPVTLASMDNCSHNGDKLREAILTIAEDWCSKGFVERAFVDYVSDSGKVTYPLSMIDKITPRPSEEVQKDLEKAGIEDMSPIITSKNSYMAPFVNAEISEYLVIEDKFANGRPKLEKAGVIFTDRETVNKVETMKVTTCLNPLHTALAVSGCLLGYTRIWEEVRDEQLKNLITAIGYDEGLKVVVNPGIIEPKSFIDEVVNERFANPYIPDSPQRIATDTSQKVGIRFGETIKAYNQSRTLDVKDLKAIPMAIALWCRYLMAVDDQGSEIELSSDPLLDELTRYVGHMKLGMVEPSDLKPILSNEHIFGMNLYEVGLGKIIEGYFDELTQEIGSVRKTLIKYYS